MHFNLIISSLLALASASTEIVETDSAVATTGQTYEIKMSGLSFSPSKLTIKVGDTVKWNFNGNTHTVTESSKEGSCTKKSNGFDSGEAVAPQVFTKTFTSAGDFPYYCAHSVHCMFGMKAIIKVE